MQNLQKILPKFSIAFVIVFVAMTAYILTRGNTVEVEAGKIKRSELVEAVYATGYVEAENIASLSAEYSGTVRSVGALEGERVRKGQKIIVFDSKQPRLAVVEARAAVAEQQALVRDDQLKLERNRTLFKAGAISQQQFDEAERNSAQSLEALRRRKAQLDSREDDMKKLTVIAPFDGMLTLQSVKEGDYVTASTVVAVVADTSRYLVVVEVDELDVPRLSTGLKAVIAFDSMPDKRFDAAVVRIVPQTDRVTKTSRVYLRLDDRVAAIQGGMTATANIVYNVKTEALLARKSSVFEEQRRAYVWKIVDGKLEKQQVKTGDSDLTFIEILDGLSEGDQVVTSPQENFRDGMETRIVEEPETSS